MATTATTMTLGAFVFGIAIARPAAANSLSREAQEWTPSVRIESDDRVAIDRMTLVLRTTADHVDATLTLVVSTRSRLRGDSTIELDVPSGAAVTRLDVAIGDGPKLRASPLEAVEAGEAYHAAVEGYIDPALLQWRETSDGRDQLELHAFPITPKQPATIAMALTLPRSANLVIDPGGHAIGLADIAVDGHPSHWKSLHAPRVIELGAVTSRRDWMAQDPSPHVGPHVSLFAHGAPPPPVPTLTIATSTCESHSISAKEVRTMVKLHIPQLRHCYTVAVQGDHSLQGVANLHYAIEPDGSVDAVSVDGELSDQNVRSCLAAEVSTWRFYPTDTVVAVNYPLRFELARQ